MADAHEFFFHHIYMTLLQKYAYLLVNYSLSIQAGDKLFIQTTTLAEPLVKEIYREALRAGAAVIETDFIFRERTRILLTEGNEMQLQTISPLYKFAMETFDAYLHIRAPFNLKEDSNIDGTRAKIRSAAVSPIHDIYMQRTGTRALKRNLCQYPTDAAAQEAGMSLEEYTDFVFHACKLFDDNPIQSWLEVRAQQQHIVDYLNTKETVRYVNKNSGTDIKFNTKGRVWINSDGQTNMPSGEVYTSPVEDTINGKIRFTHTGVYGGSEVEGVTLWVKNGIIEKWDATRGKDFLDRIFNIEGARQFGEAAIGTNSAIQRITKNILFDEKIGGTVHMAIGQSYEQCGGKNKSSVHWDMITDMTDGGKIFADGKLIYQNGLFLI